MDVSGLIAKKLAGKSLSPEEISFLVHGYSRGRIKDGPMTTWLRAVYDHGMTDGETIALMESMISSGERMDFSHLRAFVADKHSTGGVGDKVSLILGPLMAAAGLAVPMISGRSLGHTGGTCDKLESIPGYRIDLPLEEFQRIVETVGISMIGQTDRICPADKKIYSLRDATGTVTSIPLICSSIMSKKISEGIQGLVLDIKAGNGAFMKTVREARALGEKLKMVGKHFGISVAVIYSNMNQPLGRNAGLWIEVEESVEALHGNGPGDLMDVTFELGTALLVQAGRAGTRGEARKIQHALIENGRALQKLVEMVDAHGGDSSYLDTPASYERPAFESGVTARETGYVTAMNTLELGLAVNSLTILDTGENRELDWSGGVRFEKKLGDAVSAGDRLATCFGGDQDRVNRASRAVLAAMEIRERPGGPGPLFYS